MLEKQEVFQKLNEIEKLNFSFNYLNYNSKESLLKTENINFSYDENKLLLKSFSTKVNKGDKILIEGRIRSRSWEDKESGQMRFITEILADQMQMIGSVKKSSEDSNEAQEPSESFIQESPIEQEDLPF